MRILCLNVWGGKQGNVLLDFLRSYAESVDVFCFQEVFAGSYPKESEPIPGMMDHFLETIIHELPDHQCISTKSRLEGDEILTMAIRNTLTVSDHRTVTVYRNTNRQPQDPPSNDSVNLQAISVEYKSKPLTVAQVHGYWEKDEGEDKPARTEQTDGILRFVDSMSNPIVLCGDFNTNHRTQSIARISKKLHDLVTAAGVSNTRASFCPYAGTRADYAFTSPELRITSFKVLTDEVSDHLPLLIDIA